ncbi:hypothetical protein [Rhodopila sp.]|uniref:hypothetical protein n=1 Tax=Rhodopila sp. TaxID=2480087 RepID=UPI003D14CFD7
MPIAFVDSPTFHVGSTKLSAPTLQGAPRVIDSSAARKALGESALGTRIGCYIFAIQKGQRHEPWYVGKATKSFAQEVFNDSNCKKYCEALALANTGKPVVFFVLLPKARGAINKKAIDKLETMLVEECGGQNPDIRNQRKSRIYRTVIHGVVNAGQGKPPSNAIAIRKMMGRD